MRTKLILLSRGWVSERKRGRVALVTPAIAAALLPATTRKFAECYPAIA